MFNALPRTIVGAVAFIAITVGQFWVRADNDAPPALEFVGMPAEFVDVTHWAIDLFDQAELDLPPLRFTYHGPAGSPCSRRPGLHRQEDGVDVIKICTTDVSLAEGLILHELAHAWLDHHLTEQRKAAFKELRGWTYWQNYEAAAWHQNGTEQAAEIMVWGLIDRPIEMIRLEQNSCAEMEAGFRTLTGQATQQPFQRPC
jgi:hypothetical protein